jgi:hypothetical protein
MPYSDPHTAAPGLWALRQSTGCTFEVATATLDADPAVRKGVEALEVSRHRVEFAASPTLNFGRMPNGWRKSSGNNRRLVEAGKRFRGGPDPSYRRVPDAPPPASLDDDPLGLEWLGHEWSAWSPDAPEPGIVGLYRAVCPGEPALLYIGQGRVATRRASHLKRATLPEARVDFPAETLWSWAVPTLRHPTQLLEFENDLIASHVLSLGQPPRCQFVG